MRINRKIQWGILKGCAFGMLFALLAAASLWICMLGFVYLLPVLLLTKILGFTLIHGDGFTLAEWIVILIWSIVTYGVIGAIWGFLAARRPKKS